MTSLLLAVAVLLLSSQVTGQRKIDEIFPDYGPVSGGTTILIFGGNFTDLDRIDYVNSFENISFTIGEKTSDTVIHTISGNVSEITTNRSGIIRVYFGDGTTLDTQQTFTYRPDPVIESVHPRKTIKRGGIEQTVVGRNLDSVLFINMTMTLVVAYDRFYIQPYDYRISIIERQCRVNNSTLMYCDAKPFMNYPHRESFTPTQGVNKDNYQIFLGFDMDGVTAFKNYTVINVFADPKFDNFPESNNQYILPFKVFQGQKTIEIKGEHLKFGAELKDFIVQIGNHSTCQVTEVITNQLTCRPPQERPTTTILSFRGEPNVKVKVGYLVRSVGHLKYELTFLDDSTMRTAVIATLCVVILLIFAILVTAVMVHRKRKREQLPPEDPEHQYTRNVGLLDRNDPDLRQELEPVLKDAERLKLGKSLGEGNFGCVHAGKFLDDDNKTVLVAAKTLKESGVTRQEFREFLEEATIMKGFNHPNVLHLVGVVLKRGRPYVLLPFMENGYLRGYLSNKNNCFTVENLLDYACQAAKGMAYLEGLKKIHRDLAARNCMVSKDDVIKIADFGLARDIYHDEYYRVGNMQRPLPVKWMAPECLDDRKFTSKSDVWSYGVLMWELLTRGKRPYSHIDNYDIKPFLQRGNRLEKPGVAPDEIYEIMLDCWNMIPHERPCFDEIATRLEEFIQQAAEEVPLDEGLTGIRTTTVDNYLNLSRYVDYNTDRHGYERLSTPDSYLPPVTQTAFENIADPSDGYIPPVLMGVPNGYVPPVLLQASNKDDGPDNGYLPPKAINGSTNDRGIQNQGYSQAVPVSATSGEGTNPGYLSPFAAEKRPSVLNGRQEPVVRYQNMAEMSAHHNHQTLDHSAVSIQT